MHVPVWVKSSIDIEVVRHAITKIHAKFEYGDASRHAAEFISKCGERKSMLWEGVACFQCEQSKGSRCCQHGREFRRGLVVILRAFFVACRVLRGGRRGRRAASEAPVSSGLCRIGRGSGVRRGCRRRVIGLFRVLLVFFAGFFEKPDGTRRRIKIKSPTPRMISRNMNVNLRES